MVLVGYLASNKLLNNKGIETFRDRLMFDKSNKINYLLVFQKFKPITR